MWATVHSSKSYRMGEDYIEIFSVQSSQFHQRTPRKPPYKNSLFLRSPENARVPHTRQVSEEPILQIDTIDQPAIRVTLSKHDDLTTPQHDTIKHAIENNHIRDGETELLTVQPKNNRDNLHRKRLRRFSLVISSSNLLSSEEKHINDSSNTRNNIISLDSFQDALPYDFENHVINTNRIEPTPRVSDRMSDEVSRPSTSLDIHHESFSIRRNSWNCISELSRFAAATQSSTAKTRGKTLQGIDR